jgi:hypothetical protein
MDPAPVHWPASLGAAAKRAEVGNQLITLLWGASRNPKEQH